MCPSIESSVDTRDPPDQKSLDPAVQNQIMPDIHTDLRPVHVVVPTPLWQEFTYLAPKTLPIGAVVLVSFGARLMWGVLWKEDLPCPHTPKKPLKTIISGLELFTLQPFTLSPSLMQWMTSMARYLVCPLGLIVKMTLPPAIQYAEMVLYTKNAPAEDHAGAVFHPGASGGGVGGIASPALLESVFPQPKQSSAQSSPPSLSESPMIYTGTVRQWARTLELSLAKVRSLVHKKEFVPCHPPALPQKIMPIGSSEPLTLNAEQTEALGQTQSGLSQYPCVLLEGVTGSGKTEVLLALSQSFWDMGKQVLVLLPEIMLSYPWCNRVKKYFDMPVTLWHSAMSPRMRQEGFENIVTGQTRLIIGARSALALPYANLGLIIVDEEHEMSYKQSDSLLYHGRDMAVLRGTSEKIPVVLASATPSMESRMNVVQNRYGHVRLNNRYGGAQLPTFSCIDMRPHPPKENAWISPLLRKTIQETLDKGEQTLLFLNRRGYACLWMCYQCGYRAACHQCSAWMTVHEKPEQLLCHYCGYTLPIPDTCPGCHDQSGILLMGPGIERIVKEVSSVFPTARTCLLSSDHVGSTTAMTDILDRIAGQEIDILIGTQLIAKGYHFPHLTCIGIVDTDFALNDMDFRASERLFQLLYQVAGRAGRAHRAGHVFLQTMQPDYPLFQHLRHYNWDEFVQQELDKRRLLDCPPMTRLTAVIVSHVKQWEVEKIAAALKKLCPHHPDIHVFGPAPAPLNPLRGRYRWRFLLKTRPRAPVYAFLKQWLHTTDWPRGVGIDIDRDPYFLL
ncbi:MAG: primosomal protein N' [Alphaproteobacteria bacterium]|nr:primosomal protein N' [Alphaproteobacteria bacterium]